MSSTTLPKFKRGSQTYRILQAYKKAGRKGYTPFEAAQAAEISVLSCYWKRASELRKAGLVERTGSKRLVTETGAEQFVLRITTAGREYLAQK